MDLNLGSIIKSGIILAFMLPAFSILLMTLPSTPPPVLASNNTVAAATLASKMNSTSSYIQKEFLSTVTGMNTSLNGVNGSFSANPTVYTAFAFILNRFGMAMQSIVMIPYIDLVSMNFLATGTQYALPPVVSGIIALGIELLYAYMILSILFLGISMIEKYDAKTG